FAYAGGWDPATERYIGLQAGRVAGISLDNESVVVKPEAALRQLECERDEAGGGAAGVVSGPARGEDSDASVPSTAAFGTGFGAGTAPGAVEPRSPTKPRRFHGSVTLSATRLGRDASDIA